MGIAGIQRFISRSTWRRSDAAPTLQAPSLERMPQVKAPPPLTLENNTPPGGVA